MSHKPHIFPFLIALLVISGCVDKIQTQIQAENSGWDHNKYEEYSQYYNDVCGYERHKNCNNPSSSYLFGVKEKLIDIHSEGSDFERTWYMAFFNLQNGLEIKSRSNEIICNPNLPKKLFLDPTEPNPDYSSCKKIQNTIISESNKYFSKSIEYRQKIENMKPKVITKEDFELEWKNIYWIQI